jgi:hypothetical protein
MEESPWKHFITLRVSGKPPFFDSGIDPKGAAHVQYPLVTALEREARIAAAEGLQNTIPPHSPVRLEIHLTRHDYNSEHRVSAPRIIGGISSVLEGMIYFSDLEVREVSYEERKAEGNAKEGYEVRVYYKQSL